MRALFQLSVTTLALVCFGAVLYYVIPPVWHLKNDDIIIKNADGISTRTVGPSSPSWTNLEDISKHTVHAFVAAEDGRFYQHKGFDTLAILESIKKNLSEGKIVRGGSTITQQVVKLAFLEQDRTFKRKSQEILGALLLEALLSKDEILSWYLNLIPLGKGLHGIGSGAKAYYDTTPEILTIQESINLAIILPSPNKWSAGLKNKHLTDFGHKSYLKIINRMFDYGYITRDLRDSALATGDFGHPIKTEW